MKIAKKALEEKAKRITDNLLCGVGLKNAKKVASMVKKSLVLESQRRQKMDKKQA